MRSFAWHAGIVDYVHIGGSARMHLATYFALESGFLGTAVAVGHRQVDIDGQIGQFAGVNISGHDNLRRPRGLSQPDRDRRRPSTELGAAD
jgi:hypothetical protein